MEGTTQKNKSNFGLAHDCSTVLDQRVLTDTHVPRPSKATFSTEGNREGSRKTDRKLLSRMRTEEARRSYA